MLGLPTKPQACPDPETKAFVGGIRALRTPARTTLLERLRLGFVFLKRI